LQRLDAVNGALLATINMLVVNMDIFSMKSDIRSLMKEPKLSLTPDLVKLIAEIDEFKGRWQALEILSPERLQALRKVATVESVGSLTRIEGVKLTDAQVES